MSAPARVEPGARRVIAGDSTWSFDVDVESGGVTLALDSGPLRLRPLRWREKRVLARFAGLGPAAVGEQLLRLATGSDRAALPDGDARGALLALAAWLDAPSREPLPLDGDVLAAIMLTVCSAGGLRPTDLDDLDVADVEALWRAAGQRAEPPARSASADDDGLTRILIVPDEPARTDATAAPATRHDAAPASAAPAPTTEAPRAAATSAARRTPEPRAASAGPRTSHAPAPPAPSVDGGGRDPGVLIVPGGEPARIDATAAPATRHDAAPASAAPPPPPTTGARLAGRGRPAPVAAGIGAAPLAALRPRSPARRPPFAPRPATPAPVAEPPARSAPAAPARAGTRPDACDAHPAATPASGSRADIATRHGQTDASAPQAGPSRPAPLAAVPVGADDVLEELSRRLAQAADELGIARL